MTPQEAQSLARVLGTVDSGCLSCGEAVCRKASAAGRGYEWRPDGEGRTRKGVVLVHVWRDGEPVPVHDEPTVVEVDVPR